jgi:hypothetical protein
LSGDALPAGVAVESNIGLVRLFVRLTVPVVQLLPPFEVWALKAALE